MHYTSRGNRLGKAVWGKLYVTMIGRLSRFFVYDHDLFSAAKMMEKIAKYKVTTFCAPPTIYRYLIKENLDKYDLSSIQYWVTAGEAINPIVYQTFLEKTGFKLYEAFGQTELVVTTATWPWLEPKPGSMGKPSPGYTIELLDNEGNKVEVGEEGELCIKTDGDRLPPGIFGGSIDRIKTQSRLARSITITTGDIACRMRRYLWYVGRRRRRIKVLWITERTRRSRIRMMEASPPFRMRKSQESPTPVRGQMSRHDRP